MKGSRYLMPIRVIFKGVLLYAGVLLTTAFIAEGPSKPESWWPQSWVGWGAAILIVGDILARGLGLYKWGQKGVLEKLDRMEKHFDAEIKDTREEVSTQMNHFSQATESKLNGFGSRVEQVESDVTGINATLTLIQIDLSASKTDRVNINRTLDEIKRGNDRILDHILKGRGL